MDRTFICRDVLADLDRHDVCRRVPEGGERRLYGLDRRVEQLAGWCGVAQLVRAFTEETGPAGVDVHPRPHAVPALRRAGNEYRRRERKSAYSRERVGDDLRLQLDLRPVRDVRVKTAAAGRIEVDRPAVWGRLDDVLHGGERQSFFDPVHARHDPLAWNRTRDEHDLSLVPRNHPSTRRGLFNQQLDDGPLREAHRCSAVWLAGGFIIRKR